MNQKLFFSKRKHFFIRKCTVKKGGKIQTILCETKIRSGIENVNLTSNYYALIIGVDIDIGIGI